MDNQMESSNTTIQITAKNVTAKTGVGFTAASDVLQITIQDRDSIKVSAENSSQSQQSSETAKACFDSFEYFKFKRDRDLPSDARSTLLVVAAVIATVSFQAGLSPPASIFDSLPRTENPNIACWFLFLFANSLGLTTSMCIIIYLTAGFPFRKELHISLYSMIFTYGVVIYSIINGTEVDKESKELAYALVTAAFVLPFMQRWIPRGIRTAWRKLETELVVKL